MTDVARPDIKPAFAERNIPIALSTDENYLPYVKVVVNSIISCTKSGNIDILILHNGIPPQEIDLFLVDFAGVQNASVRFVNIKKFVESTELSKFDQKRYLSAAACYRLLLPDVLDAYDKLIYLDVDTVVCHDLGELYATDLADNMFGAVIDVVNSSSKPDYAEWARGYGFVEWDEYVNTGVMLFNLARFRCASILDKLMPIAIEASKWFCDQDALNFVCKGQIVHLDPRWNVQVGDYCLKKQIALTGDEIWIAHFTGGQKPWNFPLRCFSNLWWRHVCCEEGLNLWRKASGDNPQVAIGDGIAASVVIPIYNAESYLAQTLISYCVQTLGNIEIICIDDGSTDGSRAICEKFASLDSRIRILSQKNLGAAVARNRGIEESRGRWLFFGDADDFCRHDMLEELVRAGQNDCHDVVVAGRMIMDCGRSMQVREVGVPRGYFGKGRNVNCHTDGINVFAGLGFAPWNKLFRRAFVIEKGIKFHNIPTCDDAFFVFSGLIAAQSISFVGKSYYYYRANLASSQMGQADKTPTNFLVALKEIRHLLDKQSSRIQEQFYRAAILSCFDHLFAKKTSAGRRKAFSALQKGGLTSLGFPHIDTTTFDFGSVKRVFDLTMAGGSLADVIAEHYSTRCDGLLDANSRLKMENAQKREEIQELRGQRDALRGKLEELRTERTGREGKIAELRGQRDELRGKLEELRTERTGREGKIAELRGQRVELLRKIDELRIERKSSDQKIAELRARRDELRDRIDALRSSLSSEKKKSNELREARNALKERLLEQERMVARISQVVNGLEA